MARTPSNMLALGTQLPSFELFDTTSHQVLTSRNVAGKKGTVVMFICNHCPFVIHLHKGIQSIIHDFLTEEFKFVAISSNDVDNYPQDGPQEMTALFQSLNLSIPYLFDETQEVAKAFEAACTPDFYLFDSNQQLVYRGQFDDSRPGNDHPVTGQDLRHAISQLLRNEEPIAHQHPSLGCNIKWK